MQSDDFSVGSAERFAAGPACPMQRLEMRTQRAAAILRLRAFAVCELVYSRTNIL